ncbi:nucleophosmin-like [Centruroides vittatus]|uniref:nucleophosmin-like n=1 Tax=Centruroides vittatus TaxID=120091 RepID=UPI00350EBA3C
MTDRVPIPKEFFWACKLDKSRREGFFCPETKKKLTHSLLLKKIVLGPCRDSECEVNVIEIETTDYEDNDITATLAILQSTKEKRFAETQLDIMVPRQLVKLKLVEGSGPVSIFGHHITVFPDYSDDDDDDEEDEEEQNEEKEDEIEMKSKKVSPVDVVSEKLTKKRKVSKSDGLPKKIPKMEVDDDCDQDDEADDESEDDDDYEQESSPEKPKKRIETPSKKTIKATPSKNKDKKVSLVF